MAAMPREYEQLKRTSDVLDDPLLTVFERYCEEAATATDALEWSWKLVGWQALSNRVYWLGAGGRTEVTARALEWLASELAFGGGDLDGGLAAWRAIVRGGLDRALVAYAGANPLTNQPAAIKMYLVLDGCDPATYRRFVRPVSPSLPEQPPPPAAVVLLCHRVAADGRTAARVYVLFNREDYERPDIAAYVSSAAGSRALEVARQYPRSGFALKRDTTDMLGIGLRPTGRRTLDPECLCTPVMIPLANAAARVPELHARLHRVSWVTIPLDDESLAFPRRLREMNIYVVLDGHGAGA